MTTLPSDPQLGPDSDSDHEALEAIARTIKPVQIRSKKGKKFADKDFMLSLVDSVNKVHESKIQSGLLKRMALRDKSRARKKETKGDRVAKMKEKLRHGSSRDKSEAKGKGDHRKFDADKKKSSSTVKPSGGFKSKSSSTSKSSSFKPKSKSSFTSKSKSSSTSTSHRSTSKTAKSGNGKKKVSFA